MRQTSHFYWFLLFALAMAASSVGQTQPIGFVRSSRLVLIMPFENDSSTPGMDWVGDSFPEVLGDRLSADSLMVISRNERIYAFDRLGIPAGAHLSRATIYEIAQQIDADYVVLGHYRYDGVNVTASAQVMDMARLRLSHEVSEAAVLTGLIRMQTELAWDLLGAIRSPGSGPAAGQTMTQGQTKDQFVAQFPAMRLDALENYMRGVGASGAQEKVRYFKEALRLDPAHDLAMLELARTYYDAREYEMAGNLFSKIPRDAASANEARFYQGLSFFYAGQMEKAEAAFRSLAARLPLTEVYNNLGVTASRRGDKRAREYFEKSVQDDPSDPDYHFNLAVVLQREGETAGAMRQLRESVRLRPDPEARLLLETIVTNPATRDHLPLERLKRNYDESSFRQLAAEIENRNEERLKKTDARTHGAFHVHRGRQLLEQGLAGEAEKEFREAIILDPLNAEAHTGLALVFESRQEREAARNEARAALHLQPSAEAYLALARLDLAEHNPAEAAQNVDRALELEPDNAAAQSLRHDIAAAGGRPPAQP